METLDQMIDELSSEVKLPTRIIGPGFEKRSRLDDVKRDLMSRGERRRQNRKQERLLEIEDKLTLDALKLRETLDPSRFYKKKATANITQDFQIGTIIEHPIDYYASRATKKERKQTLIDELISDDRKIIKKRFHRLKATDAIRKKEKALAERRKLLQGKKKNSKTNESNNSKNKNVKRPIKNRRR